MTTAYRVNELSKLISDLLSEIGAENEDESTRIQVDLELKIKIDHNINCVKTSEEAFFNGIINKMINKIKSI